MKELKERLGVGYQKSPNFPGEVCGVMSQFINRYTDIFGLYPCTLQGIIACFGHKSVQYKVSQDTVICT